MFYFELIFCLNVIGYISDGIFVVCLVYEDCFENFYLWIIIIEYGKVFIYCWVGCFNKIVFKVFDMMLCDIVIIDIFDVFLFCFIVVKGFVGIVEIVVFVV